MNYKDVLPGVEVRYSATSRDHFMGRVSNMPWQLRDGTWVVHLRDMEPAYGEWRGEPGRSTVKAAAVHCLRLAHT